MSRGLNEGLLKHRISSGLKALDKQSSEEAQHDMGWNLMKFVREYRERKKVENMREVAPDFNRRKSAGYAWEGVLAFVCILVISSAIWLASRTRQTYFWGPYPDHYLRVVQNLDPCESDGTCGYRRLMQAVVDGVPNPETPMTFCEKPRFEQGHTLLWIRLTNIGSCWAIDGWAPVTENGIAKLSGNCKPDYTLAPQAGHVACDGGKAKFE